MGFYEVFDMFVLLFAFSLFFYKGAGGFCI